MKESKRKVCDVRQQSTLGQMERSMYERMLWWVYILHAGVQVHMRYCGWRDGLTGGVSPGSMKSHYGCHDQHCLICTFALRCVCQDMPSSAILSFLSHPHHLPSLHPTGTSAAATCPTPLSVARRLNCADAFRVSCISNRRPRSFRYLRTAGARGRTCGPVPIMRRSGVFCQSYGREDR